MSRFVWPLLLVSALVALPAVAAQPPDNPEDEWKPIPNGSAPTPAPPPSDDVPPPPAMPGPAVEDAKPRVVTGISAPRPVLEPNTISMHGARSLGFLKRGEMFYLGFPMLGLRLMIGLTERFDFGIGFDSFYFMDYEPLGVARLNFFRGTNWSMAATLEGGYTWFQTKASADLRGSRWLTGRRNGNLSGGFIVSYQGDHPRAVRLFLSLQYLLTFDTEPYQKEPLGGVPSSVQYGHNGLLRAGAEMPLSAKTSFVFLLGLDVHGRMDVDSVVMPVCSVGLVTSI
jgi:hypothetical protein